MGSMKLMEEFQSTEVTGDIIVDVHEPIEFVETLTKNAKGKIIKVESLPTDYMLPGQPKGWALERKTVSDFLGTFTSDRFADQMLMLKQLEESGNWRTGLLLEGNLAS